MQNASSQDKTYFSGAKRLLFAIFRRLPDSRAIRLFVPQTRLRRLYSALVPSDLSMKHFTVAYVARRITLIVPVVCALLVSCSLPNPRAAATNNELNAEARVRLFPVVVNGKYGFINVSGKIVIQPQFDDFNEGFFEDAWAEGLAAVCVGGCKSTANKPADGKWGFIDSGGRLVINPQFDYARPFSEGLSAVLVGTRKDNSIGYSPDLKWGFIDKTARYVAVPQFSQVTSFKEGFAAVCVGNCEFGGDGKEGYIDKMGKFVINPQFDSAYAFSNGLAQVEMGRYNPTEPELSPKRGYIDKTGKYVWNPMN
jgi:hypothetical protein